MKMRKGRYQGYTQRPAKSWVAAWEAFTNLDESPPQAVQLASSGAKRETPNKAQGVKYEAKTK